MALLQQITFYNTGFTSQLAAMAVTKVYKEDWALKLVEVNKGQNLWDANLQSVDLCHKIRIRDVIVTVDLLLTLSCCHQDKSNAI